MESYFIDLINDHQDLLKENNYDEFYYKLNDYIGNIGLFPDIGEITDFFMQECGINVLNYLSELPKGVFSDSKQEKIFIPDKFTIIPEICFVYTKAKEIILPETLEIIGRAAFFGSEIPELIIPKNVVDIQSEAFIGCKKLSKLHISENTLENIDEEVLDRIVGDNGEHIEVYK